MKLLRSVIVGVLFLAGVFLASANTGMVELVYLPPLPLAGLDEGASVRIPVFIVVLGSILIGVVMTGLGVLVEQSRLRWTARGALKKAKQKEREWSTARGEAERMNEELATAKAELVASRAETDSARERLAQTEARFAKVREELRGANTSPRGSVRADSAKPKPSRVVSGEETATVPKTVVASSGDDNGDGNTGCG